MKDTIEAIIFDLGRVLIDLDLKRGIFGLFDQSDINGSEIIAKIMADPAVKLHNSGKISSEEFYDQINSAMNLGLTFDEFCVRWCDIFSPVPKMGEFLRDLRKKYKIGLLSDTDPLHWHYVRNKYEYLKLVPNPALSYEIGTTKPDKEIYIKACELTGCLPEKTLYIDDLEANVTGAVNAGMKAFVHTSPGETIKRIMNMTGDSNCRSQNKY